MQNSIIIKDRMDSLLVAASARIFLTWLQLPGAGICINNESSALDRLGGRFSHFERIRPIIIKAMGATDNDLIYIYIASLDD